MGVAPVERSRRLTFWTQSQQRARASRKPCGCPAFWPGLRRETQITIYTDFAIQPILQCKSKRASGAMYIWVPAKLFGIELVSWIRVDWPKSANFTPYLHCKWCLSIRLDYYLRFYWQHPNIQRGTLLQNHFVFARILRDNYNNIEYSKMMIVYDCEILWTPQNWNAT